MMKRLHKKANTVRMMEVVFPNDANHYGTLFGGKALQLMDKAAYLASTSFCGMNTVTASVERIDFKIPIKVGEAIEITATVVYSGKTSMVVRCDLFRVKPFENIKNLCTTGHLVMVALGKDGKPATVPILIVSSNIEKNARKAAASLLKYKPGK